MEFKNLMKSAFLLLALCVGFTSCDDDNDKVEPEVPVVVAPETVEIKNAELKAVLKTKGFITFNKEGELVQNDTVLNLTTLDLSGSELTDISGLEVFPKLTEVNLSDNNFGYEFDFSVLPSTIKGVDLTKNEIFYYNGLVTVVYAENGEPTVTVKYDLTKLHLPNGAKYDIESIVPFYLKNKSIDMKMENKMGVLEAYTTLREVPDVTFRDEYLKLAFPSLFDGDKIDLSKHLSAEESTMVISIAPSKTEVITDLTGIEYIIRHPEWSGPALGFNAGSGTLSYKLPYIKLPSSIKSFTIADIDMSMGLNLSKTESLKEIYFYRIKGLEKIDISMCSVWGQGEALEEAVAYGGTALGLIACTELKEVLLPEKKDLVTGSLHLESLPALEKFDISGFIKIDLLVLGLLPAEFDLVYPNLTHFEAGYSDYPYFLSLFGCTSDIFERQATKDFLNKNYWSLEDGQRKLENAPYFNTEEALAAAVYWYDFPSGE